MNHHIWEAVCIILFIGLIFRPAKRFILGQLDEYSGEIAKKIQESDNLKTKAEETLAHYKKLHKEFTERSALAIENTKENIAKISKEASERLKKQIIIQRELHQDRIKLYEIEAVSKLRKNSVAKAFIIAQQYFKDHMAKDISEDDINDSLDLVKKNKTLLH